jgi:hypothetical protein
MIFESKKDRDKFVRKVAKSLKSSQSEDSDEEAGGDEIPLDKVLPPAAGHGSGTGTPNTSARNQPYYGGSFVETIEPISDRLCRLLSEVDAPIEPGADQTAQAQTDVRQGQVGTTGVLGHSKGSKRPSTAAGALRQEVDPYATRGKATRAAKKEKAEEKRTKGPQKPEKAPESEEQPAAAPTPASTPVPTSTTSALQ